MKFNVGDKVKTNCDVGIITYYDRDDNTFLVTHDTWREGHSGASSTDIVMKKGFAPSASFWFLESEINLLKRGDSTTCEDLLIAWFTELPIRTKEKIHIKFREKLL